MLLAQGPPKFAWPNNKGFSIAIWACFGEGAAKVYSFQPQVNKSFFSYYF